MPANVLSRQQEPVPAQTVTPSLQVQPNSSQFDLTGYVAALTAWIEAVGNQDAAELRPQLAKQWQVDLQPGRMTVSMEWLDARLKVIEEKPGAAEFHLPHIVKRLEAMREQAAARLDLESPAAGVDARSAIEEILRRTEFGAARQPSWLDRMRAQIAIWIRELVFKLLGPLDKVPELGRIIVWLLVALAACVLVISIYRRLRRVALEPLKPVPAAAKPAETWQKWMQLAREAAAAGNYRTAIHHLYWAAIYRLAESGAWRLDRTRTHREYLRMLPAGHPNHAPLKSVTWRFESVWYGGRSASEADFQTASTELESLVCESSTPAIEKS